MKPMSHITDPRFVKAMAHPLRVRILGALEQRTASPSELAQELEAPLGNVSYHVRQLHALGLLKLVKETPRRGAVEHYYRLEGRPWITDGAWSKVPPMVKEAVLSAALSQISDQVNAGATAGGFDRANSHLSRLPMTLDAEGFKAASRQFGELARRLKQIEDESRHRLATEEHAGETAAVAVLMLFEGAGDRGTPAATGRPRRTSGRREPVAAK